MMESQGCEVITFESFARTGLVRHCFSTRLGGVSEGVFASMNLGLSRGDARENVLRNYEILAEKVGCCTADMVFSQQVHGVELRLVTEQDKGNLPDNNPIRGVDGLITETPGVVLVTFYADCVPLFFLDMVGRRIALSHAGWRGTAGEIARLTVEKLCALGSEPENILMGIGPSIGQCCFEVDAPVADEFKKLPEHESFVEDMRDGSGKSDIDLWAANKSIAVRAGILPENIEVSGLCTKCNPDLFYSHRRMGNERGSMCAFMELI